MQGASPRQ